MKRKRLFLVGITFATLCVVWVAYTAGVAIYWQSTIGGALERDLGFRHGTPYLQEEGVSWHREVLTVESVVPGGVFEQAGFRSGDVILDHSINDLFRVLHHSRGQQITIRVVDGGDGPPVKQRPAREITFDVPDTR